MGCREAPDVALTMAPPRIGPAIMVRLPPDLLARLDAEAARHGVSRAETIRDLLKGALK